MAPPRPPYSTLRRLVVDEVDDVYFPEDLTGAVPFLVQNRQVTASDACSDAREKESSGTRTNADRKGTPERYVKCSSSQTVSAKAKALRRLSKFPSGGDTIVSRGGDDSASEGSATSRTHRTLGGKGPGEEHSSSHVRRKAPGVLAGAPCSHERGVGSVEDVLAGLTVAAADSCTTSTAGDRGVTPAPGVRGGTGTVDLEAVRCSADWRASRTHCQNNRSLLSVAAFPEGTGGVETTNSCAITEESGRLPISEALPPLLLSSERTSTGERGERVGGSTTEGSRIPVAGWWTDQSSERKRSRQLPPPPRSRVGHPPALQPSETRCARVSATSGRSECLSTQQVPSGCGRRSGGRDDNRSCQKVDDSSSGGDSHSERTGPSVSEVCLRVEARGSHGSPAGARSALSYNSVIEQNGLPEREVVVKSRSPALLLPAFKGSRPLEAASCLEGGKNSGGVLQLGREWTAQVRCLNEFVRSSKKSLSVLPLPPVQRDLRAEETASLTRTPTDHQRIGRSRPSRVWTADNHTTGAAEKGDTHVGVSGCPPSSHCSATPPRAPCAGRCAERSRSTENEKNPAPSVSPASCFTPTPNNLRSPSSLLLPPLPYPSVQRPACFLARPSRWALAETSFQLAGLGRCRSQQEKSTCSLPSDDTERRRSESRPEPPPPGNKQSHRSCSATSRTAAAGQRHSGSCQNCLPPAPRKLVPPSPATSRLKPSACADRLQQQEGTAGRSEKWRRETTQSFAAMQRGKAGGGSASPERRGVGARDSSRSGNTGRSSLAAGLFDLNEGNTRRPLGIV
ncbi:hypothetical protein CSUI_001557 [Cystoisospora suis]|uniref:Uncharacterized protein n=1 Tax=Cystoisospora suis TaxID=483139 RepID=A0A2C6LCB5_9APIC|nr:hypothetical protein CSUI_001557 [Cystoisospora suis]